MATAKGAYETYLREDLVRLGITALVVVVFLVVITALQQRTGFMNALVVLPDTETVGAANQNVEPAVTAPKEIPAEIAE